MSSIPLYTGGGTDDPATVSQFKQARTFSGATGITEIAAGSNNLSITNPNGPVVTITDNGVAQVNQDVGIEVTPVGTSVTIKNTGVRSIQSATSDILVTNGGGGDPAGTGDITLLFQGSGGGGTTIPAEAFSIVMQHNTADLQVNPVVGTASFLPFFKRPAQDALWTTSVPGTGFSPVIGAAQGFSTLAAGSLDLTDSGTFTVGISGLYIFVYSSSAICSSNLVVPLGIVKNVLSTNDNLFDFNAGTNQNISTKILHLEAGDTVTLGYWSADVTGSEFVVHNAPAPQLPEPSTSGYTQAPIFFSGALLPMTTTATAASVAPERFAVTLDTDFDSGTANDAWVPVTNLTQVLDTVTFPDYHPEAIFNNLNLGSLDLAAGKFTVGVTGHYILTASITTPFGSGGALVGFRHNGTKILRAKSTSGEAAPFVSFQYFTAGDEIELVMWNSGGVVPRAISDGYSGVNIPHIIWSGYIVRSGGGGGGGGGTSSPESFSAALSADLVTTGANAYIPVTPTTTSVDTGTLTLISPTLLYDNLTVGSYNAATATFTVGITGDYIFTFPDRLDGPVSSNYAALLVDGAKVIRSITTDNGRYAFTASLVAGQTVQAVVYDAAADTCPYTNTNFYDSTLNYSFVWSGSLIQGSTVTNNTTIIGGDAESFSIAMAADLVVSATANVPFQVTSWTDTVNAGTYPDLAPEYLYRRLSGSTVDLSTGIFTAGSAGQYQFSVQHPNLQGDTDDATMMLKVGTKYVPLRNVGDNNLFSFNLNLAQGDTVGVWGTVNSTATITFPYSLTNGDSGIVKPALVFSGQRLNATVNIGDSTEAFQAAMEDDKTMTNSGSWIPITASTLSVDTGAFPEVDTSLLFDSLSVGNFNIITGVFTVGITGVYLINWIARDQTGTGYTIAPFIDDTKFIQGDFPADYGSTSMFVSLTAGQTVQLKIFDNGTADYLKSAPFLAASTTVYNQVWGAALIRAGSGGGGGGGAVASVVAGTGISVDSTDPANPIVTNEGVRTLSSSHAYLTVNNTDPRNPVLTNNGVLTVATSGVGSGLEITGTANNPIFRNTGIRSITSGTPATLSVVNNSGAVTLSVTGGGGGGGGAGTVVGVTAAAASGAEVPNVGLTITNPTSNVQIQNNAVLRVTGGSGISITGDQRNRAIAIGDIGTGTNYTRFNPANGFMTMSGTARPWKVKSIPMIYFSTSDSTLAPGGNEIYAGARSWFPSFRNAANVNSLTGFWPVPYEMAWQQTGPGQYSTLTYFGINWTPNTTAAGNVRWRLRWKYLRAGDLLTAAAPFTTDGVTQAAGGVVGSLRWTGFFAVNLVTSGLPNTGQGDVIAVSVQRDPDDPLDTYPDQALFMGLRIVYQIDQLGGRQNTAR